MAKLEANDFRRDASGMNRSALLRQLDHERRHLIRDDEAAELLPEVTRLTIGGSLHTVVWSNLDTSNADAVIRREVEHHRALHASFEWKAFSHDRPADLRDRLVAHDFSIGPAEAVMVAAIDELLRRHDSVERVRVERITTAEQLDGFRRTAETIFGKDYAFTTKQLARAIEAGSDEHSAYLALVDGTVAAIGRLYTHPESRFAGLYGGATLPAYRGRGCYRALVIERARVARALGATHAQVDALPTSRPILERLGFEKLTETWPCEWSPT